jgi:hypothetical protein
MKRALLSCLLVAGCGDDSGLPDARVIDTPPPPGTLSLTWSITDGATPIECADVGASFVTVTTRPINQPFGSNSVIRCSDGTGQVELAPDVYDVAVSLASVQADEVVFQSIEVASGMDTPIGNAAFDVPRVGGFSFRLDAGGSGNCTAAGLTAVQLDVARVGGGCVVTTFDIAAGASQPAGTYTTSCAAPAAHPLCIENDQTVTAQPTIPSGTHLLTITGQVGGNACWSRQSQFDVPAGGEIRALVTQILQHDDITPACNP